MKKRLLAIASLVTIGTISYTLDEQILKRSIKLESPALSLIDGKAIGINGTIIELLRSLQQQIINIILGDKQPDGTRIGRYEFQGKKHSAHDLRKMEEEHRSNPAFQQALKHAKDDFIQTSEKFKRLGSGPKPALALLIEESCALRNRSHSPLVIWAHTKETEEDKIFDRHVHSFKDFEGFCVDLLNFFGDLVRSCPKAQKQFQERVEKWRKVKELVETILTSQEKAQLETPFLSWVKSNCIDKLTHEAITKQKVTALLTEFKKQS